MCCLVEMLIGNEGQQCSLIATTQGSPSWGANRSVEVRQDPYILSVEQEQMVKCFISPMSKALEDWVIRVVRAVEPYKAKSMIKNWISGLHSNRSHSLHGSFKTRLHVGTKKHWGQRVGYPGRPGGGQCRGTGVCRPRRNKGVVEGLLQ